MAEAEERIDCTGYCDRVCEAEAVETGATYEQGFGHVRAAAAAPCSALLPCAGRPLTAVQNLSNPRPRSQGMANGMIGMVIVIAVVVVSVLMGRVVSSRLRRRPASTAAQLPSADAGF